MTSKKTCMENQEDVATDGDGEVIMRHMKTKWSRKVFSCKWAHGYKTW